MTVTYELLFKPEQRMMYQCNLICQTEREKFIIPLQAHGERGTRHDTHFLVLMFYASDRCDTVCFAKSFPTKILSERIRRPLCVFV